MLSAARRIRIKSKPGDDSDVNINRVASDMFNDIFASFCYKIRLYKPCCFSGLQVFMNIPQDGDLEVVVTTTAAKLTENNSDFSVNNSFSPLLLPPILSSRLPYSIARDSSKKQDLQSIAKEVLEAQAYIDATIGVGDTLVENKLEDINIADNEDPELSVADSVVAGDPYTFIAEVRVSTLSSIPRYKVKRYLGRIHLSLIREFANRQHERAEDIMGGLTGSGKLAEYSDLFLNEALTIARAHVAARGGNALFGYKLSKFSFKEHRNYQFYGLIELSGEAVEIGHVNLSS